MNSAQGPRRPGGQLRGPPPGSAEPDYGKIFFRDFRPYRDEITLSAKAGYLMRPRPYGEWG